MSTTTKLNVSIEQAKEMIDSKKGDPNFIIIDVRTAIEYKKSHIHGSVNIPVSEIAGRLKQLDKKKHYLVYCKSGGRSNKAANIMREDGFYNVSNMMGGMNNWSYATSNECCLIM